MFTSRRPHVTSKRMQRNPPEAQEHPFLEVLSPLCWSLTGVGSRLLVSTCSRWWPSAFSNLMLPTGRLDMDHLSPSRSCSPLLIVPVLCDLVAKALCRMSIVSGAPGVITLCRTATKCSVHHWGSRAASAHGLDVCSCIDAARCVKESLLALLCSRGGFSDHAGT